MERKRGGAIALPRFRIGEYRVINHAVTDESARSRVTKPRGQISNISCDLGVVASFMLPERNPAKSNVTYL
jgi:hypothetical protein